MRDVWVEGSQCCVRRFRESGPSFRCVAQEAADPDADAGADDGLAADDSATLAGKHKWCVWGTLGPSRTTLA